MISNEQNISLALAVWLLYDEYDYIDKTNYISATSLMKPTRQLVLAKRIPPEERSEDVADYTSRALGHSLHDSIEKAWTKGYKRSLKLLNYPAEVIERVRINPTSDELKADPNIIAVYLEQRAFRELNGYTIGGKFDFVAEGIVQDFKSTSAYSWVSGTKDEDYCTQMSIYRWLNPDKITEDFGRINFIFTDWQKAQAKSNPKYPQKRLEYKDIALWSLDQTEAWIRNRIAQIEKFRNAAEADIPECTDEELWRSNPQYKYYADPSRTIGRSSKNFDDEFEARNYLINEKGGKGVIITVPGEVKRCGYCDAYSICSQKDRYFHD